MPIGPQGQKRPADTNACAIKTMKIAIGEIEEEYVRPPKAVPNRRKGGQARAKALTKKKRSEIATKAAMARWSKQT